MNEIALITDLHWGARSGSPFFINHFQTFYETIFFPTLLEKNIKTLIILGDTFDKRPSTLHTIIKICKETLFDKLQELNIQTYIIIGNHDCPFKSTLDANSPSLILKHYNNITIIDKPQHIIINDIKHTMIPWICNNNYDEIINFIEKDVSNICFGHLELEGFQMHLGQETKEGLSTHLFRHYDHVYSGHYHHKSTKGNITYLGTPYELTWNDYNDPKGFHIFNTLTHELTFIENPNNIFVRIEYDDSLETINYPNSVQDKFLRLIVNNKNDYYAFDQFVANLYKMGTYDLKIIDNINILPTEEIESSIDLEDTLSILMNYVSNMDIDNNDKVKKFLNALYIESINESANNDL